MTVQGRAADCDASKVVGCSSEGTHDEMKGGDCLGCQVRANAEYTCGDIREAIQFEVGLAEMVGAVRRHNVSLLANLRGSVANCDSDWLPGGQQSALHDLEMVGVCVFDAGKPGDSPVAFYGRGSF